MVYPPKIWKCFSWLHIYQKYKRIWSAMAWYLQKPLWYSNFFYIFQYIWKPLTNFGKNSGIPCHHKPNVNSLSMKALEKQFDDFFFSLSLPLSLPWCFSRWLWRWTVFTRKDGWDLEVSPSWPPPKPFSEAPRPLTAYREQRPTTIWWDAWRRYVTPVELERGEISWTRTARTFKEMDGTLH